jgi:hypothetical protein
VPFGGRDAELRHLADWLFNPAAASRMLITSPAGRGKSALLVHWMKLLRDHPRFTEERWQLAFVPISIRVGTNLPDIFYGGLAQRLAEIAGQSIPPEVIQNAEALKDFVQDQLEAVASAGRLVLVVLDGLDEAFQGSFDPSIIPRRLPSNLRVVISARWQVGDTDSTGWLRKLGWDRSVRAEQLVLERLSPEAIADVLLKLGAPTDVLAQQREVVDRLCKLTEGEPILVRYYAEDLWQLGQERARIVIDDLDSLKPGFSSYFERWLSHQEQLWAEEGHNIDRVDVDRVLSILAFAFGPLAEALMAIKASGDERSRAEALGLIVPHLAPGQMAEALAAAEAIGDKWSRAKALGSLAPHLAPEQKLRVLAEALAAARAINDEGSRAQALASLAPYLTPDQTAQALAAAQEIGDEGSRAQVLGSLASYLAPEQKSEAIAEALAAAEAIGDEGARAKALGSLAPHLSPERMAEALAVAKVIGDEVSRAQVLASLAPHMTPEQMAEALAAAEAIGGEVSRAQALGSLITPHRTPKQKSKVLAEALQAADAIENKWSRAQALGSLAPHLAPKQKSKVLAEALAAAKAIGQEWSRAGAVGSLAPHLSPEQLAEALAAAKAIGDEGFCAEALESHAPYISPALYVDFITSLAEVAARLSRSKALSAISASVHISSALGGVEASEMIRRAVNDTSRWYP